MKFFEVAALFLFNVEAVVLTVEEDREILEVDADSSFMDPNWKKVKKESEHQLWTILKILLYRRRLFQIARNF